MHEIEYPSNCQVQFDFRVLDLFAEMAQRDPLKKRMVDEYFRIKGELKRRPDRLDVFEGSDIPFREYLKDGWLRFLASIDQLTDEEKAWLDTSAEGLLRDIEKAGMTKSYKIPTLSSLLTSDGDIVKSVHISEIGENFKHYLWESPLHQQDMQDKGSEGWENWPSEKFAEVMRKNPVHFLCKPAKYYHYDEVNKMFYLDDIVEEFLGPSLARHIKDILTWRKINYFRKRFREEE